MTTMNTPAHGCGGAGVSHQGNLSPACNPAPFDSKFCAPFRVAARMPLFSAGLNHTTAPIETRERLAFPVGQVLPALASLGEVEGMRERVIVSTCNRTEIYWASDTETAEPVIQWFCDWHRQSPEALRPMLYAYQDARAVQHLLRVAAGLDSMVVGEPQILGQIKDAYREAVDSGHAGGLLSRLFQRVFAAAKRIRTETRIGANPVSVAYASVSLAHQIFADFPEHTALLIGAGQTVELAARHLHEHGLGRMIIANRTLERAREIARPFSAYAITLEEIPAHLAEADIVISSTASNTPVLLCETVAAALRKRRHRPMFMVDIAVPRDIEASTGELEDVYLYSIDDLQGIIQDNMQARREAATQAEAIVDEEASRFMDWLDAADAIHTIRRLRGQGEQSRRQVMERARRRLARGEDPEQVLEYVTWSLTNKLLHRPSRRLRDAGLKRDDHIVEMARWLYGMDDDD